MSWCDSNHFGRIQYDPSATLEFEEGIPGFESERHFVLIQQPQQHPLVFLQSLETSILCMPALPVGVIDPGYQLQLSPADRELLSFDRHPRLGSDALALALIAVHEDHPTANLLAPIVVNLVTRKAAQCIDPDLRYSHRHSLLVTLAVAS